MRRGSTLAGSAAAAAGTTNSSSSSTLEKRRPYYHHNNSNHTIHDLEGGGIRNSSTSTSHINNSSSSGMMMTMEPPTSGGSGSAGMSPSPPPHNNSFSRSSSHVSSSSETDPLHHPSSSAASASAAVEIMTFMNDNDDSQMKKGGRSGHGRSGGKGAGGLWSDSSSRRRKHFAKHASHSAHSFRAAQCAWILTQASSSSFASPESLGRSALLLVVITALGVPWIASTTWKLLWVVSNACLGGLLASAYLSRVVLAVDEGTPDMRSVSEPIRQGAEGFLHVQYSAIARFALPLTGLIVLSYQFRPTLELSSSSLSLSQLEDAVSAAAAAADHATAAIETPLQGVALLGNTLLGVIAATGFVVGALCSAVSGYVSMWVAAQSNIRVAAASRRSYREALVVCFRGGAFSAVLNVTLCIAGVTTLYTLWYLLFATPLGMMLVPAQLLNSNHQQHHLLLSSTDIPMLLVGYGFGASFVALFMQLGGGIYTKAADVGADLVGKIEQSIPEDDPRNPAVIADLVGDMVGDCVGSSADVFESVAAEMIGAMILGSTLAAEAQWPSHTATQFVFFPLIVHAMDILVSSVGIAVVSASSTSRNSSSSTDPMQALQRGYCAALALSVMGFYGITHWLLRVPDAPLASTHFFACGVVGMVCAYVIVRSTQYYTDYAYRPVQSIAEASTTGHGTNIIVGVSVGMKATLIPTLTVAIAVLLAYHLGAQTKIGDGRNAGLFGTAVATMGMLSNAVYILSMNNFGPIADNAGGITEMSQQPEKIREVTDRLDAAGNVTKAITKGYSIGSASMACFLLFGAFMDEFSEYSGLPFHTVDIAIPEVLVGGLIGSMIIFYFTGLAIAAVGRTAHEVVIEVRRQFRDNPDIMTYAAKPDYERCVALVTAAALREMRYPGLVCVMTPVLVGLVFRFVGEHTNRLLLGAEVLAAYLMFGTITGILMALFLDTAGGAWDNAKKYIELGHFGGKNSEAHKAAVTGDTVGDPFKDTAGPSLHVVIKLLSTTILVAGPLFIATAPRS